MSKLDAAMLEHVAYIVFSENRPFSYRDFIHFEVNGNEYKMSHGTYRNKILKLKKQGRIELVYNSGIAFYTLKGKKFASSLKMMTADHVGVPSAIISQSILKAMPIYNWLKKQPVEKQSLHNIRLRFGSPRLWDIFSKIYPISFLQFAHDNACYTPSITQTQTCNAGSTGTGQNKYNHKNISSTYILVYRDWFCRPG